MRLKLILASSWLVCYKERKVYDKKYLRSTHHQSLMPNSSECGWWWICTKVYPNDNVKPLTVHILRLLLTEIQAMFFGKTISMKSEILPAGKLMTLYLLFEDMANAWISKDTVTTASDQAIGRSMKSPTTILLLGGDYTIPELITMTVVPSSNIDPHVGQSHVQQWSDVYRAHECQG